MITTLQKVIEKTSALNPSPELEKLKAILSEHLEDEKKMILSTGTIGYLTALKETAEIIVKRIEEIKKQLEKK
jgi:hypothetical protein